MPLLSHTQEAEQPADEMYCTTFHRGRKLYELGSLDHLGMLGVVFMMAATRVGPDVLLCGALTVLLTLGIVTPAEALSGLSNEGMVTVAVLFVVVAGLRETGGMHLITRRLFGHPGSITAARRV